MSSKHRRQRGSIAAGSGDRGRVKNRREEPHAITDSTPAMPDECGEQAKPTLLPTAKPPAAETEREKDWPTGCTPPEEKREEKEHEEGAATESTV